VTKLHSETLDSFLEFAGVMDAVPFDLMSASATFFSTLSSHQRKLLSEMSDLSRREQAMLGPDLISCAEQAVTEPGQAVKRKLDALVDGTLCAVEVPDTSYSKLTAGTGPAFEAIGKRAVLHGYITQPAFDAIRERIEHLPASEQEDALVSAMRRFCACMQPISSVTLSGHLFEGSPARLIGCAPPGYPELVEPSDNRATAVLTSHALSAPCVPLPPTSRPLTLCWDSGKPEMYNVAVLVTGVLRPLHICVEPKHFRPAPIELDERDDMHERIPADHEAEAWFAGKVLVYEMMFRCEKNMGASFGPARPC